jgi:hypothetical protein
MFFMPSYRVHYLKDQAGVDRFRNLPPADGSTNIKPKDYMPACEMEAPNEYAVWRALQGDAAKDRNLRPLGVGDVLEVITAEGPGKPRVCRYSGFDEAVWFVFEPREKKGATLVESAPALA